MKTKKGKNNNWNFPKKIFIVFFVFILVLFLQFVYLSLFPNIYGINMGNFAANRNTVSSTLYAKRGNIFDKSGNLLALNVSSYTVIAYLSPSRTGNSTKQLHVSDVKGTAEALSPILNMSVETLTELLSRKAYQVELGPGGRGITEITKDAIKDLNLPGIDFIEDQKRNYPNGDFASYVLGYAKKQDDGSIVGELGIESKYNDLLKGTDGYYKYQKDRYGYKIPDTPETKEEAINGDNIYLTIDSSIQRFVESAVKENEEIYNPEWMIFSVMDAKTGDILASASTPSFNPNLLNITSYENPLVSYAFEPGSTMKIYTYMCAMEKGTYKGSDTFSSGSIKIGDNTIKDWNHKGWGTITYDKGLEYSSNVGVANLIQNTLNKDELKECLTKYGFGAKTDIELTRELTGSIKFNYPIEVASAGFGQGITTTAVQHLQALSIIANNGKMVKPHIIDKIVSADGTETHYESNSEYSEQLVSQGTIDKIKELMFNVVNGTDAGTTGKSYRIENFDIIGKTGTAQVFDVTTGTYSTSTVNHIFSFAGMYPKDDPQIIIYAAAKKPNSGNSVPISKATKDVIKNMSTYLNMFSDKIETDDLIEYQMESLINKNVVDIKNKLAEYNINPVVIGDGDKIIKQYPETSSRVLSSDKVILVSNGKKITMPNVIGWSKKDVKNLCDILNISCTFEGYGYVSSQSIAANTTILGDLSLNVVLTSKEITN